MATPAAAASATVAGPATDAGSAVEDAFVAWAAEIGPSVPCPGQGRTGERFEALGDIAGVDLSLGRLAEGHADALAILDEAGRQPAGPGPYGVWAARGSTGEVTATAMGSSWRLDGRRGFCSGVGTLRRALVTAEIDGGTQLFDVDVTGGGLRDCPGSWPAVGMADSASRSVEFDGLRAGPDDRVGPPGFYTDRIGFWWGATGVAACWWGGADALLDTVARALAAGPAGDHEVAAYGAAVARLRSMTETLRWAAADIDGGHGDVDRARRVAQLTREVVHDGCTGILTAAAAAGGARPICLDGAQSRRSADLYAYLAQHHVGRDAAALGRDLVTTYSGLG